MDDRTRGNDSYYLTLHEGHGLYVRPGEERFVTGELVQHTTMTATPDQLRERVRTLAEAGVKQIAFIPTPGAYEHFVRELSEQVIARI